MPSRRWTIALIAWTLLVWTTRVGNIWGDADLSDGQKWGRTALALSFTVLALVSGWAIWRRLTWRRQAVTALALWTIGVWVVRGMGIATGDHEAAFIAVHLVLAAVSLALSVLGLREAAKDRSSPAEAGIAA